MHLDVRTRRDDEIRTVDPAELLDEELPAAFEAGAVPLEPGVRWLDPTPLVVEVDGEAWTLACDDGRVTVRRGTARGAAADAERADARRPGGRPGHADGVVHQRPARHDPRLERLLDWWVLLRGAIDGRTPHVPGPEMALTFDGPDGGPLDLARSFRPDDDPAEVSHFLATAGFVHLEGVFTEDEMAAVSADMDAAAPTYSPGDGRSWWARTGDGADRLVRMQGFDEHSPTLVELLGEERFLGLGKLGGAGYEFGEFGPNRIEALVKPIGVVEGISDVPWHKDCANGRHSYDCCSLTVGISVTGADAESGQLRVVAGSHRVLVWPAFVRKGQDLPIVDLPTRTGDVTIHLSCTSHMAQPPVSRERRVLYTGFSLPAPDPEAQARGKARLRQDREAAPLIVSQQPATPA